MLGWLLRKYGIPFNQHDIIDASVTPSEPRTIITESFPNDGDLDTTAQDIADWVVTTQSMDVVSGKAQSNVQDEDHHARANSNLSGDDHYTQGELHTDSNNSWTGVIVRHSTDAVDHYEGFMRNTSSSGKFIRRVDTGTPTTLVSDTQTGTVDGDVVKLEVDGSSLELFRDADSMLTATDTDHTGFVQGGIMFKPKDSGANSELDVWEAADLAGVTDDYPHQESYDASIVRRVRPLAY